MELRAPHPVLNVDPCFSSNSRPNKASVHLVYIEPEEKLNMKVCFMAKA